MELDQDLASRQEARNLIVRAAQAQERLSQMDPKRLDAICAAVAQAFSAQAESLARLAVEETCFGNVPDKLSLIHI